MNKDAKPESEAQNKNGESISKEVPLPEIGKRFYIDGQLFKVTYVNLGRKRFSAEVVKS